MPSNKVLEQKKALVDQLAEKLKKAKAGVFIDYKGITVADDTALRAKMRESGVDYAVVKNTLTKMAAEKAGIEGLDEVFFGTTALAVCDEDMLAPAKLVYEFAKDHENFKIKSGFVEGKVISIDEINALATIPSKEVLVGQLLGLLTSGLRGLAVGLKAVADKKDSEAA